MPLRAPVVRRHALPLAGMLLIAPSMLRGQRAAECSSRPDSSARGSGPSIAMDVDPGTRYLVGDSLRIGLALNNAPSGEKVAFAVSGIERARIDGGNVIRWRAMRGSEGFNFVTVAARQGAATLACRQVRLTVERTQRAPIVRLSSRQVQATSCGSSRRGMRASSRTPS